MRNVLISFSNLQDVNLRNVDMSGSKAHYTNFSFSVMEGMNLSKVRADYANFSFSFMDDSTKLDDLRMVWAIGDGTRIRTFQINRYHVVTDGVSLAIGWDQYPVDRWLRFNDEDIFNIGGDVMLEWWKNYKDLVIQLTSIK